MKLYIKEKVFSLGDKFTVNDAYGEDKYVVEGEVFSWGKKLHVYDRIGREVAFGVGVNCGPAVVGNIGCETRMDYTAIGDTVNTAARLEGKALGGQVVISENLRKRLEGRIVTEPLGEMTLKGKAEPLAVHSVLGFVPGQEHFAEKTEPEQKEEISEEE